MDSMHHDPILEREAEYVVQALRGKGKIRVEVFPHGAIVIAVTSRAVKRQVEELLGTLGLQSPYEVMILRSIPHPDNRVRVKRPS